MKLTNDRYVVIIGTKNFTERYYRDDAGWLKISARGRKFRLTAEQVLNHVLPALAGIKRNLTLTVEHRDLPARVEKVTDKSPLAKRRSYDADPIRNSAVATVVASTINLSNAHRSGPTFSRARGVAQRLGNLR